MTSLEQVTPGSRIHGLLPGRTVTVVQIEWHGSSAVTVTHRDDDGHLGNQLLFRDDESRLEVEEAGSAWAFDADGRAFKLVSEALRIRLAHLFDPYLAVTTSNLEPLPHQIKAVYGELLPRRPLRYVLADDPGAGKTIMAGLFMKELIARGDLSRCLVVAPGSLVEQWQEELWDKFRLHFDIITKDVMEASRSGNPFAEKNLVIARLDHIARNDDHVARLEQTDWDLIVIDEAHKMSAHFQGRDLRETKRYRLGKTLGTLTRHFLLMTATPHSGKEEDFQLFMALLDQDRFEGRFRQGVHPSEIKDLMRRLVKEELYRFDGRPLFPERRASSVEYTLSDKEARLYSEVTDYVREEMNRADRLKTDGQGSRKSVVGFALTILQRRLASSPEAIHQSLRRRRKRLEDRLREARLEHRGSRLELSTTLSRVRAEQLEDLDDLPDSEIEELEEEVIEQASAAATVPELEAEIKTLERLEVLAREVRSSGTDRKWEQLSELLSERNQMFDASGARRKLIIFTEHVDTLNYLADRIRNLLGRDEAVVTIHGSVKREDRRKAQEAFTQDKEVSIMVATDAAGEGINLQRAHLLVNYDLPWNPNRIEQRFGRIHRIGQTEVCHMWNLIATETREGEVFKRLLDKLETMRKRLGGSVFDVLGAIFTEEPLRDLLISAVRYGERPEVRSRLQQVVDDAVDHEVLEALQKRALVTESMSLADVTLIKEDMERAETRKLQPHFIRSFFIDAFVSLGGRIPERERGRYEITYVPAPLRGRVREIAIGAPLLKRYERVTFDKELVSVPGKPLAEFVCPGHPLLEVTVDVLIERNRSLLKQGAVLIDDLDPSATPRLLVYLEHSIQDARTSASGKRMIVSKRFEFVEIQENGGVKLAGYAPYLDYRVPTDEEKSLLQPVLKEEWLRTGAERTGIDYGIEHAIPHHLDEVRRRTVTRVERTLQAVNERLLAEINYWDHRSEELKEQERAGEKPQLNSAKARQRADDLQARLAHRRQELSEQMELSPLPPLVAGAAVVIPAGLVAKLCGESLEPAKHAAETERVERLAVDAVLAAELALAHKPTEMAHNNPGYDIESRIGPGDLRFIEVKGRVHGAREFTVTKREILTSKNQADRFILALVEVAEDDSTTVRYLRQPFPGDKDVYFDTTAVNYQWDAYFSRGEAPS